MKRFRFPLEPLLRLRELRVKQEDKKLARLLAERQRLHHQIENVQHDRTTSASAVLSFESLQGADMRALATYLGGLNQLRASLHQQEGLCQRRIAEQQAKCIQVTKEQKLLEKLRSTRMQEWSLQMDREQEALASELFLNNYVRRKSKVAAVCDEK